LELKIKTSQFDKEINQFQKTQK